MSVNDDNSLHLDAVSHRIGGAILEFCEARSGQEFFADELRVYVLEQVGVCAPGSADRVLRDLRFRGAINYVCVSRAKSRYRIDSIDPAFGLI